MTRARQKNKSRTVSTGRLNLANEWLRCFTEAIPLARSGWQRVLLRLLLGYKNRLHKRVDPKFRQAGHSSIGTSCTPDGTIATVQSYFVGTAPDGTQFIELLDLLFGALFFNQAVIDINADNYTTDAFNVQAWSNTYLFSIDSKGKFATCCVLGFHDYIFDPSATPQPR